MTNFCTYLQMNQMFAYIYKCTKYWSVSTNLPNCKLTHMKSYTSIYLPSSVLLYLMRRAFVLCSFMLYKHIHLRSSFKVTTALSQEISNRQSTSGQNAFSRRRATSHSVLSCTLIEQLPSLRQRSTRRLSKTAIWLFTTTTNTLKLTCGELSLILL